MKDLSTATYWKVGGPCERFYDVNSVSDIKKVLNQHQLLLNEVLVIGNGTNILFDSNGYDGCIVRLSDGFSELEYLGDNQFKVGSGVWTPFLVRTLSKLGFGGIEHCVGIPATFGGLVAMNGGSQRKNISQSLVSVEYLDNACELVDWSIDKSEFSYRSSPFKNSGKLITSAIIKCNPIEKNGNRKELLSILSERRKKFPRKHPNCGSVFLSSPDIYKRVGPPGMVIESLGLKGYQIGGAKISELHANFIINTGNATSDDILKLVKHINDCCEKKYKFRMEAEAIFYPMKGKPRSLSEE